MLNKSTAKRVVQNFSYKNQAGAEESQGGGFGVKYVKLVGCKKNHSLLKEQNGHLCNPRGIKKS